MIIALSRLFIIQNVSAVTVGIFFWTISLSCPVDIFVLAIGFTLGWFLHSFLADGCRESGRPKFRGN